MDLNSRTEIGVTACQTAMGWVGIAWSVRGLVAVTLPRATESTSAKVSPRVSAMSSTQSL